MKQNRFKRLISMLVVLAMLGTMVPTAFAAEPSQFVDFPQGWSKDAMTFAVDNGIINGKSETTIEPEANLTRAEMAAIINRAFGAEVSDDISAYTDISSDSWYYNDIGKAVHMETFHGDGNGKMRPDDFITREEVMAVLARALVLESDDFSPIDTFGDYSSVSQWARPYLAALIGEGYVDGYEDKTLRPLANITREEFVQLMYNIFKTYLTVKGSSYDEVASLDCVMINQPDITLSNVTIEGDLVLGDGVGTGRVNLNNVKIKGRLLARGGFITLTDVTADEGVVVKNVNGRTHFFNWRTDSVFDGVREITYTTYLESTTKYPGVSGGSSAGGGGGGGGSSSSRKYDYSVTYYFQSSANLSEYIIDEERTVTGEASSGAVKKADIPDVTNYVYNKDKSTSQITITSGDNELKVYYDLVKHSVSYTNPDGTTGTADIAHGQKAGDVIDMPDTYTDDDGNSYDVEWKYTDPDGNEQAITPDYPVTDEGKIVPVLYAKVVFDYNYPGSEAKTIRVEKGKNIGTQLPEQPVRDGYTFEGWNTKPDGSGDTYTADTEVSVPVTVYAVWKPVSVEPVYRTVAFAYNYTGAPKEFFDKYTDVLDGSKIVPPENNPSRDGFVFEGWYKNAECTVAFDFETENITSDITLYAKWREETVTPDVHTVTFNSAGGSDIVPQLVSDGSMVTRPSAPIKIGYDFIGWYTEPECINEYNFNTPVTSSFTLYAKWDEAKPGTYTVSFETFGGTTIKSQSVASGEKAVRPADPEKSGYTFGGWYTDMDCTVAYDFSNAVNSAFTLYAKWIIVVPDTYTVEFVTDGGTEIEAQTVVKDSKATKPADPEKNGYTFGGWYTDTAYSSEYDFETPVTNDITLYAKWTPDVYDVTFITDGGSDVEAQRIEHGEMAVKPEDPVKDGYNFLGWYTEDTFENYYDFTSAVTANTVLYAKWEEIIVTSYVVTFETYGGTTLLGTPIKPQTVAAGEQMSRPADPVKEGYDFEGWYTDDTFTVKFDFKAPVNSDITVYANYIAHTFDITFESNGGSEVSGQTVSYGELVTEPEAPVMNGYSFIGWFTDHDLTELYDFTAPVKESFALYAKWEIIVPNEYKVTFVNEGGTTIPNQTVLEGNKVNKPSTPRRTGYTFGGWYLDEEYTNAYDFNTPVNSSFTLYAKWNINIYDIVFESNGGSAVASQYIPYNTAAVEPEAPVKDGYNFIGWYSNKALTLKYDFSTPVIKDMKLYAKWEVRVPEVYYVTFRANGGSSVSSQRITEGGKATEPAAPKRTGYTFDGWYSDSSLTNAYDFNAVVTGNITLYAKWNINQYKVSFVTDCDEVIPDQHVNYRGTAAEPEVPVKEGYTFIGWYSDSGFISKYNFAVPVVDNITLYAKWELNKYTVEFDTNSGSSVESRTVEHGSKVTTPASPEKEGYTFAGWYTDSTLNTAYDFDSAVVSNFVLYAKWDINKYTVIFESVDGTAVESQIINHGDKINEPAEPSKEGYTFNGWYTNASYTNLYDFDKAVTGAVTLYAKWEIIEYTVAFVSNGGSAVTSQTVAYGKYASQPAEPFRNGYVFDGWYTGQEFTTKYDFATPVTGNITLYAKWIELTEKFKVDFYYGVNEADAYIGTVKDVIAGSSVAAVVYEKVYADEGIVFEEEGNPGYVDGSYAHMIYPELRYQDSEGNWKIFDETTAVTSDMKVYYTFKYIQLMIDGSFLGIDLSNVSLYTHYASDTRFMDSLKDAMQLSRDPISNGLKGKDAEIIKKLSDTTGLIDTEGYIEIKPFGLHIAEIIDVDDIRGEIKAYLKKSLSGTDIEISKVIEMAELDAVIDIIGAENLSDTTMEAAVEYIKELRSDAEAYEVLCAEIVNTIVSYSFFDEFMNSFVNKTTEYTINSDTIKLAKGVANAVYDFSADEIITLLRNKGFGAFINLYGEDEFKIMFAESQQEYYDGIMTVAAQLEDGSVTSTAYTTKMNVKINLAKIFEAVVNKFKNKLVTKLNGDDNSYYKNNTYLVEFVEQDIMSELFDYDASAVSKTNSGYKIKPIIEYYDIALENLILFDKALLWYGDLTEQERDEMRDKYAADLVTMFADINEILASTQDGTDVFAGYTLDELKSLIDSVLSMIDKMGDNSFGGLEKDLDLMLADVKESLEKLEETGETPLGFTVAELTDINTKLSSASEAYGNKDYTTANELYAEAIAAILNQIVKLVKEIDTNGTINGEDFNEKLSHIPIINKLSSQIISMIGNMASNGFAKEYTKENILETFDVERIEDIVIGHDTDDRFTVDTVVDFISQYIQDNKIESPEHSADEAVIDQYEKISGDDSITLRRYLY